MTIIDNLLRAGISNAAAATLMAILVVCLFARWRGGPPSCTGCGSSCS